jgi:hypothetical protein
MFVAESRTLPPYVDAALVRADFLASNCFQTMSSQELAELKLPIAWCASESEPDKPSLVSVKNSCLVRDYRAMWAHLRTKNLAIKDPALGS